MKTEFTTVLCMKKNQGAAFKFQGSFLSHKTVPLATFSFEENYVPTMYREASFHSFKIKTLQIRKLATEYSEIRFQQQEIVKWLKVLFCWQLIGLGAC